MQQEKRREEKERTSELPPIVPPRALNILEIQTQNDNNKVILLQQYPLFYSSLL